MIRVGDCLEVMATMEPASFTACVTDPPYGLGFMGKDWDRGVPGVHFWAEVLRLLKPGGMLLAFGGSRTYHRLACAIEDAGFEIRDCLAYMYGTGFPKSLDISKAIDKAAGAERAEGGREWTGGKRAAGILGDNLGTQTRTIFDVPATEAAKVWDGYGTALKPAWEPVIVAMKPLDGTFAQNALKHGVAGVNVDGCRINAPDGVPKFTQRGEAAVNGYSDGLHGSNRTGEMDTNTGRWPANVVLDEDAAGMLDAQSGELAPPGGPGRQASYPADNGSVPFRGSGAQGPIYLGERGGASRFFYTSKVSPGERGSCSHPTMKPLDLMRWLLTLVTMPSGTRVLDPFAGSGSTLVAARQLGIDAVGIEINPEYAAMAERRIASVTPSMFAEDR